MKRRKRRKIRTNLIALGLDRAMARLSIIGKVAAANQDRGGDGVDSVWLSGGSRKDCLQFS